MSKPSIIVPAITQFVEEARPMVAAMQEAEAAEKRDEQRLNNSREAARARRLELGMYLRTIRAKFPARDDAKNGWTAFLEAIEMSRSSAHILIDEAGKVSNRTASMTPEQAVRSGVAYESPPADDAPPHRDEDAPRELAEEAGVPQPEVEIDRDTWCTPRWLTDALGQWDLDPCANERSHVQAKISFDLERRGENGLKRAAKVGKSWRVFINPPYSDVMPWAKAFAHTRFCFLLKVDPSTKWFAALLEHTELVLIPRGTRIQFEAPEGVPPEKALANQFPHALFYANADDVTDAIRELCFPPWRIR